jgi:hypothetical protein
VHSRSHSSLVTTGKARRAALGRPPSAQRRGMHVLVLLAFTVGACGGRSNRDTDDSIVSSSDASAEADATPVVPFPCKSPRPLGGGLFACEGGFVHRPALEPCFNLAPATPGACSAESNCRSDDECNSQEPCLMDSQGDCFCSVACNSDDDCGGTEVCLCGDAPNRGRCLRADCGSDAECDGLLCTSHVLPPRSSPDLRSDVGFSCQLAEDACAGDSDCADGERCLKLLQDTQVVRACVPWSGEVSSFPGLEDPGS